MKTKLAILSLGILSIAPVFASNWHFLLASNADAYYYFDADSVDKESDRSILVWVKTVRTETPAVDGSWSNAIRWKVNCKKRTLQDMMMTTYNRDGKMLQTHTTPSGKDIPVVPDSSAEGMLKTICEPNFPNDKSSKSYFKIGNNDPILSTQLIYEHMKAKSDPAPK